MPRDDESVARQVFLASSRQEIAVDSSQLEGRRPLFKYKISTEYFLLPISPLRCILLKLTLVLYGHNYPLFFFLKKLITRVHNPNSRTSHPEVRVDSDGRAS